MLLSLGLICVAGAVPQLMRDREAALCVGLAAFGQAAQVYTRVLAQTSWASDVYIRDVASAASWKQGLMALASLVVSVVSLLRRAPHTVEARDARGKDE